MLEVAGVCLVCFVHPVKEPVDLCRRRHLLGLQPVVGPDKRVHVLGGFQRLPSLPAALDHQSPIRPPRPHGREPLGWRGTVSLPLAGQRQVLHKALLHDLREAELHRLAICKHFQGWHGQGNVYKLRDEPTVRLPCHAASLEIDWVGQLPGLAVDARCRCGDLFGSRCRPAYERPAAPGCGRRAARGWPSGAFELSVGSRQAEGPGGAAGDTTTAAVSSAAATTDNWNEIAGCWKVAFPRDLADRPLRPRSKIPLREGSEIHGILPTCHSQPDPWLAAVSCCSQPGLR
mmetsp:Transcript_13134/g.41245  ORF Transcript_13134/g.41245 Transcript_13134/m.41245 type:complete len:288 (-) Transcript_13134:298-1161(-)